jgi:hypothetical protein
VVTDTHDLPKVTLLRPSKLPGAAGRRTPESLSAYLVSIGAGTMLST